MIEDKNIVALDKLIKEQQGNAARDNLQEGQTYDIDTTVHVTGTLRVGNGGPYTPTVAVPLKEALALFLVYSGMGTGAQVMEALGRALRDSIENTGKGQGSVLAAAPNAAALQMLTAAIATVEREFLAKLPKSYKRGPVTTNLQVEEIAPVNA